MHLVSEELERALLRNDPAAFGQLFDLYADQLLRLGYAMLGSAADAEDVVQDTLIRFMDSLRAGRYRPGNGTLKAYLKRSVRNRCIDRLRTGGELHLSLQEEIAASDGPTGQLADLPWRMLDEERLREAIEHAIQKLPAAQRAVIVLRVMEEHSYAEIAEDLGISINYVKNLLGRARKRLRQELGPIISKGRSP